MSIMYSRYSIHRLIPPVEECGTAHNLSIFYVTVGSCPPDGTHRNNSPVQSLFDRADSVKRINVGVSISAYDGPRIVSTEKGFLLDSLSGRILGDESSPYCEKRVPL